MVVTNNDGGGIFSFLPQAEVDLPDVGLPEHFEEVMGTPHGVDIPAVATALGAEHHAVGWEPGVLAAAVADSVGRPGVRVLEVRTDRARNVALHRDCQAAVAAALERLPVHA
jgi:2-succinyl-5-enolpyruvyl-6-hydroxy-3-cyclohexene-1-carboxylate synthase